MLSRCTACALALVLFFAALAPTVFADSTNHKGNDFLKQKGPLAREFCNTLILKS